MTTSVPLLRMADIHKRFDAVIALEGVTFDVEAGSVHGVVGENGAGKSTLIKIISGTYRPTQGTVEWDGEPVHFRSPAEAQAAGISVIHQELSLLDNLTVAENIFLGREQRGSFPLSLDRAGMNLAAAKILEQLGLDVAADRLVADLPIGLKQLVELAKALSFDSRLIIMDEPTSSLTVTERDRLLDVVRQLQSDGVAVLYISHRLDEILNVTDMVTVLRDGQHVTTQATDELGAEDLVSLMVGRTIEASTATHSASKAQVALRVTDLEDEAGELQSISFDVGVGEIVGLAGLIGAGRTAVAETLFGIRPASQGSVAIHGKPFQPSSPRAARSVGLALVPEDRRSQGLFLDMAIHDNLTITALDGFLTRFGILRRRRARTTAAEMSERLQIKMGAPSSPALTLSGGNQQKLVIGRWLAVDPSVILLDEPTRGVDVGAKAEIREVMRTLAAEGKAILMISSDLPELLSLCDRILVLYQGEIVDEIDGIDATEERVVAAASGPETS